MQIQAQLAAFETMPEAEAMEPSVAAAPIEPLPIKASAGLHECLIANERYRYWFQAEYLGWHLQGMNVPALVTTAPRGNPAVLGDPETSVIYGDGIEPSGYRGGGRIRFGMWINTLTRLGLEGEYIGLADWNNRFAADSAGVPTISRPFLNAGTNQQDSQLVGFLPPPGEPLEDSGALSGVVTIDSRSVFQSAGLRFRQNLCWYSPQCAGLISSRIDWTVGYRYMNLNEGLAIREDLVSLDPAVPDSSFVVRDIFDTNNEFHGADFGVIWEYGRGRWSLDVLTKLALGGTHQRVRINGSTTATNTATGESATSTVAVPPDGEGVGEFTGGGLLAQRTNIGTYTENNFSLIPELGVTLGYQVSHHVRAKIGYSLIYWANVVRPGDQIDPGVNTRLLPDEIDTGLPVAGAQRPAFAFDQTTMWAQGWSLGFECRW